MRSRHKEREKVFRISILPCAFLNGPNLTDGLSVRNCFRIEILQYWSNHTVVTEERIRKALIKVAEWASEDPAFLPSFEQLERDLAELQSKNDALTRAHTLAQSATGPSNLAA